MRLILKIKSMAKQEQSHTTEKVSEQRDKKQGIDVRRNKTAVEKRIPAFQTAEKNFELLVDGVPYWGKSIPFLFNEEIRFRITLGDGTEHLFTWDSEIGMLRFIDDDSSVLPVGFEEALSEKLT